MSGKNSNKVDWKMISQMHKLEILRDMGIDLNSVKQHDLNNLDDLIIKRLLKERDLQIKKNTPTKQIIKRRRPQPKTRSRGRSNGRR